MFLLIDQHSHDLELEDARSVIRARSLRQHHDLKNVQAIVQLVRLDSMEVVQQAHNVFVTCMDEVSHDALTLCAHCVLAL